MLEIATYVRPGVIGGAFGTGEIKLLLLGRKLKNFYRPPRSPQRPLSCKEHLKSIAYQRVGNYTKSL
ncbi:MAG: hypothetical protein ACJ74W_19670 [Pyrinomonadaceae bacterium]